MGQADILDFLEGQYKINSKKYFTETEIHKALNYGSCATPLRALRKHGEVDYRIRNSGSDWFEYRHKVERLGF
jgi:hypothetical protein